MHRVVQYTWTFEQIDKCTWCVGPEQLPLSTCRHCGSNLYGSDGGTNWSTQINPHTQSWCRRARCSWGSNPRPSHHQAVMKIPSIAFGSALKTRQNYWIVVFILKVVRYVKVLACRASLKEKLLTERVWIYSFSTPCSSWAALWGLFLCRAR